MVHLELNRDNQGVLAVAAQLASRCDARVIGVAACQPIQVLYSEGWTASDVILQDRAEITQELQAAEAQFRTALAGKVADLEWRSMVTYELLADYIASQAASVDLIITGKDMGADMFDESRRTNIGDLVMRAGRPVLLVPEGITSLKLDNVYVGWKDRREARRAVADALPLLQLAGKCTVLEVCATPQVKLAKARVDDVAAWLATHGVQAVGEAVAGAGNEAGYFHAELLSRKCHLLVAGAYGHNRFSEWVFGGVTQDVLLDPEFCVLLSH
jgi:nucleotide-binding universal stress UspA family protein